MYLKLRISDWLVAVTILAFVSACDRPFVDPATPDVDIVSPDLSQIVPAQPINVVLSASGFRPITAATLNGESMSENLQTGNWELEVTFRPGVTALNISVTDASGGVTDTTEYAVAMSFALTPGNNTLRVATGGHATTPMFNGTVIVTGGAQVAGGQATNRVEVMPSGSAVFQLSTSTMVHARTGHTATLLPNGKVLLAGGASSDEVTAVSDLVEEPELFDPDDQSFEPMVVVGDPIRRSFHTASVRIVNGDTIVDLYGGRGDIQYTPEPRLGTRADIRSFRVSNDTLYALSPAVGPNLPEAISGHTQTPLFDSGFNPTRYLIAGSYFVSGARQNVGFTVDFSTQQGIITDEVSAFTTSRTRHAAARLTGDLAILWGGRQENRNSAINEAELYILPADRFINLPFDSNSLPVKRFGHTATVLFPGRLLIVGGFSTTGVAIPHAEIFDYQL